MIGRLYNEEVAPPENKPASSSAVLPGDEEATDKRLELRVNTPGDGTRSIDIVLDGSVKVELIDRRRGLVCRRRTRRST